MKKYNLLLILIALLQINYVYAGSTNWYLFKTKACTIEFPDTVKIEIEKVPSEIGELTLEITMYEVPEEKKDSSLVYGFITTEYPDSIINSNKKENLSSFFRNAIDGAVKNVEGKLLTEKEIEMNGFPGREFRVDFKEGMAVIKMRIYLVHNKLFMLQTITEPAKELNGSAKRFMDSFRVFLKMPNNIVEPAIR